MSILRNREECPSNQINTLKRWEKAKLVDVIKH